MGKQPVFAQYFADEGVGVGQADAALGSLADVGDDVGGFDLVGFYHKLGHRRVGVGFVVMEYAHAFVFEEADAEAVGVSVGRPAAQAESFKGENDVGWGVAVHAPKLYMMSSSRLVGETGRRCAAMVILTTALRLPETCSVAMSI